MYLDYTMDYTNSVRGGQSNNGIMLYDMDKIKYYVYAKWHGEKTYKAFDLSGGVPVTKLIYATIAENTDDVREKLQCIADQYKTIALSLQLRDGNGKVVFQTK